MQTVNVPVVDTRAMAHRIITTNAALVAVKGILTTLGAKPLEAVIPVQAEQFITNVNRVQLLKPVLMVLLHRIILLLVVLLDIRQHGHLVAVLAVIINGMDIITFCVQCVDV